MSLKKLLAASFIVFNVFFIGIEAMAAPITPATVRREVIGSVSLVVANFSAGTADDGDTWDSNLKGILGFWTSDTDNPTTQASVGVAVSESSDTFTFYPAEDNKSFYLFVLCRS